MAKSEKSKKFVKFLVSPTGAFNLAYSAGEVAEIDEDQAKEVVGAAYAQYTNSKGEPLDGGESVAAAKDAAAELKAVTTKAKGFGIEVPKDATSDEINKLIDDSHTNALAEVKTLTAQLAEVTKGAAPEAGK